MDERLKARKLQFKSICVVDVTRHAKKRAESDEARKRLIQSLRESLARDIPDPNHKIGAMFAKTLMYPDAMVSVPTEFANRWTVIGRPDGQRAIIVLRGNVLTLYGKSGFAVTSPIILDPFSVKPNSDGIFEGIFTLEMCRPSIYIFDVLSLKNNDLICAEADFRHYFLRENWPFQSSESVPQLLEGEQPLIQLISPLAATKENINSLYQSPQSECLVFYKRDGKYVSGLTEDALIFRDDHLSRYAIDTSRADGFEGTEDMQVVLKASTREGLIELRSEDGHALFTLEKESLPESLKGTKRKNVKVTLSPDLKITDLKKSVKPVAHSFARIVDQFRKRRKVLNLPPVGIEVFDAEPLTIQDLQQS